MDKQKITVPELTQLLRDWQSGDQDAFNKLLEYAYPYIHKMAKVRFASEPKGNSLETMALVNELYINLTRKSLRELSWANRKHFFKVVSIIMKRILIDKARKSRAKGKKVSVSSNELIGSETTILDAHDFLALNQALDRLEQISPRQAHIIHLKFYIGLSNVETAEILGLSERTVYRDWNFARSWLSRELGGKGRNHESQFEKN